MTSLSCLQGSKASNWLIFRTFLQGFFETKIFFRWWYLWYGKLFMWFHKATRCDWILAFIIFTFSKSAYSFIFIWVGFKHSSKLYQIWCETFLRDYLQVKCTSHIVICNIHKMVNGILYSPAFLDEACNNAFNLLWAKYGFTSRLS
jgi:hypothetical protein